MHNIKNVEIFSEGTWNGNKITPEILKNIVDAFAKTKDFLKPVLKLGHNNEQEILKRDGLPAAGWVTDVRIKGRKLIADFSDIPEKIFKLIKNKRYRKVSVEIFSGYSFEGNEFPHILGAVALLGADIPAVQNLNDIMANYSLKYKHNFSNEKNSHIYKYEPEEIRMNEIENLKDSIKLQNEQIEEMKKSVFSLNENKKVVEKEFDEYKKESEKKLTEMQIKMDAAQIEKFSLSLKSKDLLPKSMEEFVRAILSRPKEQFSLGDKKYDTFQLVEEMLKIAKEVYSINKEDKTLNTNDDKNTSKEKQLDDKIKKYASENKVTYSQAYKIVMNSI